MRNKAVPSDRQDRQLEVDVAQSQNPGDDAADLSRPMLHGEGRVRSLNEAISTLTGLPQFAEVDAALRQETEPLIREIEVATAPRRQAITLFDMSSGTLRSWKTWRRLIVIDFGWNGS
jgi:hypothetical protein